MVRGWSRAVCVLALGLGLLGTAGRTCAKPPDLPRSVDVQCPECVDGETGGIKVELKLDILSGGIQFKIGVNKVEAKEQFPNLDLTTALLWHAVRVALAAQTPEENAAPAVGAVPPASGQDPGPAYRAQASFQRAEQLRRKGQLESARTYYQEAHLLSPRSALGRRAMQRLQEVENDLGLQGTAEEAEVAPEPGHGDKEQFQNLLRRTIPLGTVPMQSDD